MEPTSFIERLQDLVHLRAFDEAGTFYERHIGTVSEVMTAAQFNRAAELARHAQVQAVADQRRATERRVADALAAG